MDAHLFRRVADELSPLLQRARLEKIQSLSENIYVFVFYTHTGKRQLCLRYGRQNSFLFLTSHIFSAGSTPSAYVMRLRKYLQGAHAISILPLAFQRKLWIFFDTIDQTIETKNVPALLLDLREGVQLAFLRADEIPQEETLAWPKPDELEQACSEREKWPVLTPSLRRTLQHLDPLEAAALLADLREGGGDIFLYKNQERGSYDGISAWPYPKALMKNSVEETFSDALRGAELFGQERVFATIVSAEEKEEEQRRKQKLKKLKKLEQRLKEEEERLLSMCEAKKKAILIQNNLWKLDKTQKEDEIALLSETGEQTRIPLDKKYTIQENMERFFHMAQRGKRGLVFLKQRKEALAAEKKQVEFAAPSSTTQHQQLHQEASRLPTTVQGFCSSDGFLLLRGKSNQGNITVRKLARGHDIWLHATDGPGSHVVIKLSWPGQQVPDRTLDEAGTLAACKSWQGQNDSAQIQYAEVRHIKSMKGAQKGTVKIDKVLFTRRVPVDHSLENKLKIGDSQGQEAR